MWDGTEIFDFEVTSIILGTEVDIDAAAQDIYEELEEHQTTVMNNRARTFAL